MADSKQEPVYNRAGTHVLVYNPETDGRWECPPDYLEVALARGFELAEDVEEAPDGLFDEDAQPAKKTAAKKASSSTTGD